MRRLLVAGIIAVVLPFLGGSAEAGVFQGVAYSPSAMKTMLKAVHYPRTHRRRLSCTGLGSSSAGRYGSFRCVARWGQHGRKVFDAAGSGYGGWLCVGTSVAECKVLKDGYAPKGPQSTPFAVAKLAAQGYLQNHFHRLGAPSPRIRPCVQTAVNVWTCQYQLSGPSDPPVTISITLTPAAGGWVLAGATSGGPPPY